MNSTSRRKKEAIMSSFVVHVVLVDDINGDDGVCVEAVCISKAVANKTAERVAAILSARSGPDDRYVVKRVDDPNGSPQFYLHESAYPDDTSFHVWIEAFVLIDETTKMATAEEVIALGLA
jgi:hypothetical protein